MLRHEWSLIVNSLLVQLASGIFIFSAIYQTIVPGSADSKTAMFIAGPITLVSMVISLFHLGNPFRAYRSIRNLFTSWLSREVFFTSLFFALWGVYYISDIKGLNIPSIVWLTVGAGLLSIISMANIYRYTGKPGWASLDTYTSFLSSILILGCIGSVATLVYKGGLNRALLSVIVPAIAVTLIILALRLVHQFILIKSLKKENNEWTLDNLVAVPPMSEKALSRYKGFIFSGWVLSFAGLSVALYIFTTLGAPTMMLFAILVIAVFAGEFLGRCGFYLMGLD